MNQGGLKVGWPIFALLLCGVLIFAERIGIKQNELASEAWKPDASQQESLSPAVSDEAECLIIMDSKNYLSNMYTKDMSYVLDTMRVVYDIADVSGEEIPELSAYRNVVLTISDLGAIRNDLLRLADWVGEGGSLMNTHAFDLNYYLKVIGGKIGIAEDIKDYASIRGIRTRNNFMIGGNKSFDYDEDLEVSLGIYLDKTCKVYIESMDGRIPILWEKDYGSGRFVIINQEVHGKVDRAWLSAAYTLLQEASIYPVINASAFYIDDFPAPGPEGSSEYINKEYQMSITDFWMNIWWPKMLEWMEKFKMVYTGLIIENYTDVTKAPYERQQDINHFLLYGNMLLNHGGELGFHGYNHIPLALKGYDRESNDYDLWENSEDVKEALLELNDFSGELFPGQEFPVYVPPSNILGARGRQVLTETLPGIQAIASLYLSDNEEGAYTQEFEVADDGIVETPRVTSGYEMDDFSEMIAYNELNFHYVQSHFIHPDDILDVDRGAQLGWEKLSTNFERYLSWVYESAPNIRNVSGSQMAEAVRVFDALSMKREWGEHELTITLGGFSGEAYLMLRLNAGEVQQMEGAEYEHITGDLYLVHAQSEKIHIVWGE